MMHSLFLCITVAVVCHASPPFWTAIHSGDNEKIDNTALTFQTNTTVSQLWKAYKAKYKKQYSHEEEPMRRKIFEANVKTIEMHNYLYEKGIKSYTLGINEYADMETSEFNKVMNGLIRRNKTNHNTYDHVDYLSPLVKMQIPESVDWRLKGFVTSVKNQGRCGSCWSFSSVGALEGQHARKTGKLVSLSEQQLVDCSAKWGNHGCQGGLMDYAFKYIKDNNGIDTEESYPYVGVQETCHFKSSSVGATVNGYTDVTRGDEDKLKEACASTGPISVAIDASHQSFHLYKSGVYNEQACSSQYLDHGVLVVGYGSDGKNDFWIVKNSWGTSWGQKGYVWMIRNKNNQCGIATQASYPNV